jgi:hypothetical protein
MVVELDRGCAHLIFPYGVFAVLSVDAYWPPIGAETCSKQCTIKSSTETLLRTVVLRKALVDKKKYLNITN